MSLEPLFIYAEELQNHLILNTAIMCVLWEELWIFESPYSDSTFENGIWV